MIHAEAQAALMTRRPEILDALAKRLTDEGRLTEDVSLLISALKQAIEEAFESERRLAEAKRVLEDQALSLHGIAGQTDRILRVLDEGGTYKSHTERELAEESNA